MGTRVLSPPMGPPSLPLRLGSLAIAAETLFVYPLAPGEHRAARP